MLTVLHGWPDDARRWLASVLRHHATQDLEVLLVDNSGDAALAAWAESVASERVRVLGIEPRGFGAAVNAGRVRPA